MPRVKKEIPEAEVEVKKTNQKKNPTKSAANKKQSVKKEVKKSQENVIEKEADSKKEYKQKAFFFPRLIADIIDAIIISLVASGILMFVPQSENY